MPCRCDYMEPSAREIEFANILKLCVEANIGIVSYFYSSSRLDDMTEKLCTFCGEVNIKDFGLEMQIWWRDHQKADAERLKEELMAANLKQKREQALSKLSLAERELLGL